MRLSACQEGLCFVESLISQLYKWSCTSRLQPDSSICKQGEYDSRITKRLLQCVCLRVMVLQMYSIALLARSYVLHTIRILYHFLIIKDCHCKISNFVHIGRHSLLPGDSRCLVVWQYEQCAPASTLWRVMSGAQCVPRFHFSAR
jgi:hypothetical protein